MNERTEQLKARTKKFALDVLALVRTLSVGDEAQSVGRQLIRSATSVGANYRAACRSRSRPEFIARLGVALEESDESAFWLEILIEARLTGGNRASALLDEANQLTAILAASRITASATLNR